MMYFGVEKHIAISPTNIPVRNSGTQSSKKLVQHSIANLYNCKYSLKLSDIQVKMGGIPMVSEW